MMSIENNIERIADALEALVGKLEHIGQAVQTPKQSPPATAGSTITGSVAASEPAQKVDQAPQSVPPAPAPSVPATPPVTTEVISAPVAVMSPEDLNTELVAQFQRLGSREPIDVVMRAAPFNAQSITDLTPEQYAPLIAAVKAVKAA